MNISLENTAERASHDASPTYQKRGHNPAVDDTENERVGGAYGWGKVSHIWIGSRPYLESTLFIVPQLPLSAGASLSSEEKEAAELEDPSFIEKSTRESKLLNGGEGSGQNSESIDRFPVDSKFGQHSKVEFYDFDGRLINQIEVSFLRDQIGVLPIEPFLESCRLADGFRQARAVIYSQSRCTHLVAARSCGTEIFWTASTTVEAEQADFLPVTIAQDRSVVVVLFSRNDSSVQVRTRLFLGSRTPEIDMELPPMGAGTLLVDGQGLHGLTAGLLNYREAGFASATVSVANRERREIGNAGLESSKGGLPSSLDQNPVSRSSFQELQRVGDRMFVNNGEVLSSESSITQGYLRFSLPKGASIGVQLLEYIEGGSGSRLISVL